MVSLWAKEVKTQSSSQIPTPGEVAGSSLSPHELLRPSLQGRAPYPCPVTPSALQRGKVQTCPQAPITSDLGSEMRA